jgi:4-amino-4-deoxy-L-arabinose transferase-like glycosyltransferase
MSDLFYRLIPALIIGFVVVLFGVMIWLLLNDNVGERHQQFREYCASKGGEIFEQNNNFDCVLNGTHISYYGD